MSSLKIVRLFSNFSGILRNGQHSVGCLRGLSTSAAENPTDEVQLRYLDGVNEGVAVLAMCRHNARNAMGRNFMKLLTEAVNEAKFNKSIRALIVKSDVKGVFCAGADLKERLAMTNAEAIQCVMGLRKSVTDLENLPVPTIAAMEGVAVGGGLEMALGCDIRIAATTSKMGLIETTLAIIPGAGGTQRLSRAVGLPKAKELIFTGQILDGDEAEKIGLVNHCVKQNEESDAAYQRSLEMARKITSNGPIGVQTAKHAVHKGFQVDLATGLGIEELCYLQIIPTKDRIEALKAFQEKRPPKFEGH